MRKVIDMKKITMIENVIKIVMSILLIALSVLIVIRSGAVTTLLENTEVILNIATIGLVVLIIVLIIVGLIINKSHTGKVKKNNDERRFKFLDVFYYFKYDTSNSHTDVNKIYVIQDLSDKKIYNINELGTNAHFEYNPEKPIVLKGEGLRDKWQRVNFDDEGSFWIDKEVINNFRKDEKHIYLNYNQKLVYFKDADKKKKTPLLYNINPNYDLSLLEESTSITGVVEFDMNK